MIAVWHYAPNSGYPAIVRLKEMYCPIKCGGIALNARYFQTAAYGHFGRNDQDFTWESTDKAELLRKECGLA